MELSPCWVVGSFHSSRGRAPSRHGSVRHPIATSFRFVSVRLTFASSHPKTHLHVVVSSSPNSLRYRRPVAQAGDNCCDKHSTSTERMGVSCELFSEPYLSLRRPDRENARIRPLMIFDISIYKCTCVMVDSIYLPLAVKG